MENKDNQVECIELPAKSCDMLNHHSDSRQWDQVEFRDGDVLVGTYPKCGTSWMQQLVRYLIDAPATTSIAELSPWVDSNLTSPAAIAALAKQQHRRALKHHLPQSCLPTAARNVACFVYVARDGRDVVWSLFNFHRAFTNEYIDHRNEGQFDGPKFPYFDDSLDEVAYFERWLEQDGYPFWSFWDNIRTWWMVRNHPRVFFGHHAKLKSDTQNEVTRLFLFLAKYGNVRRGDVNDIVRGAIESSSFESMRKNANFMAPGKQGYLKGGSEKFFNRGTNSRWQGTLPQNLVAKYEETARRELGDDCAHWLATGELPN